MGTIDNSSTGRRGESVARFDGREVRVVVDLDGVGSFSGGAVVPHLDLMLRPLARHGCIDLSVESAADPIFEQAELARGIGECAGQALSAALFDRNLVVRIGAQVAPLEDALVRVVVDLTGRPHLAWRVPKMKAEGVDPLAMFRFLQGFVQAGGMTVHVDLLAPGPTPHVFQAVYRALGGALRDAIERRPAGPPPVDPGGGF